MAEVIRLTVLILPLFVTTAPALAVDYDCADPATQLDLNFCARDDFLAADAELNAVWKDASKVAKDVDSRNPDDWKGLDDALLAAQRDWIAFRDSQCQVARFLARGGSVERMLLWHCKATLTRIRTEYLRDFSTKEMVGRAQ